MLEPSDRRAARAGTSPGTRPRRGRGRPAGAGAEHLAPVGLVEPSRRVGCAHRRMKRIRRSRCEVCNVAVVGHVEWVEFARVDHAPAPGEIVHALETWEEPAGGGAVAAVQLAKLSGSCLFFTALGDDELGRRSREELEAHGRHRARGGRGAERSGGRFTLRRRRPESGRSPCSATKLLPSGEDGSLPWEELARCDAVYFVERRRRRAARGAALSRPRRHGPRAIDPAPGGGGGRRARRERGGRGRALRAGRARAAAAASSSRRPGALGGWIRPGGPFRAAPLPAPVVDAYGCGDCFAAGLTYAPRARSRSTRRSRPAAPAAAPRS